MPDEQSECREVLPGMTHEQKKALRLLARGGARYGTCVVAMKELKEMGLCHVFDKGERLRVGRFTWRPTQKGRDLIAALKLTTP